MRTTTTAQRANWLRATLAVYDAALRSAPSRASAARRAAHCHATLCIGDAALEPSIENLVLSVIAFCDDTATNLDTVFGLRQHHVTATNDRTGVTGLVDGMKDLCGANALEFDKIVISSLIKTRTRPG